MTPEIIATVVKIPAIIARIEEYEIDAAAPGRDLNAESAVEMSALSELMAEIAGKGADVEWRGNWYPAEIIHQDDCEDYALAYAIENELVDRAPEWPATAIDWALAATQLMIGYASVEYGFSTYWYKAA